MDQEDDSDNGDDDFNPDEYRDDVDSDGSYETLDENDKESPEEEYSGPILPGGHRFDRKLLCIRYPGVVENVDRAIETLGGLSAISAAYDTPNRRLELRFRPQDGYCKPTCADRHEMASFLIRVRVKKSRVQQSERKESEEKDNPDFKGPYGLAELERMLGSLGKGLDEAGEAEKNISEKTGEVRKESSSDGGKMEPKSKVEDRGASKISGESSSAEETKATPNDAEKSGQRDSAKDEDYRVPSAKVIGRIETGFDFPNLCDFQYLAIGKSVTDPKVEEYIYDSVYPVDLPPYRWLKKKVPSFLPPSAFSRTDTVQHVSLKPGSDKGPQNVIGKTRKRVGGFSNFINFDSPETPCAPPSGIETALRIKFLQKSHLADIRKKFEERPVWSKNALMCVTNFTGEQLKFLLPSVAYYFMTGPWRIMWVKLGYDPRKDPQARKYQTLDYRRKAMHGLQFTVNRKHTTSEYKSAPGAGPRTILTSMQEQRASRTEDQSLKDTAYIYRDGVVPPGRQMFYQYCDIHVPEIQGMLAKLPDHLPPGVKCHEKRGWLPVGFSDQCREILTRQVRAVLRKQMNIPEDHPTALPPKRGSKSKLRLSRFAAHELPKNRPKKKRKEAQPPDPQVGETVEPSKKAKSSPPVS